MIGGALLGGCAAQGLSNTPRAARQSATSILASSRPAARSTVSAPVEELRLHFNPPARLDEVAISGPDGLMPMMVHPAGEVADYSLPLSGLGPGGYTVTWKATSGDRSDAGSFTFTVR